MCTYITTKYPNNDQFLISSLLLQQFTADGSPNWSSTTVFSVKLATQECKAKSIEHCQHSMLFTLHSCVALCCVANPQANYDLPTQFLTVKSTLVLTHKVSISVFVFAVYIGTPTGTYSVMRKVLFSMQCNSKYYFSRYTCTCLTVWLVIVYKPSTSQSCC